MSGGDPSESDGALPSRGAGALRLLASWLWVGVPLAWGVAQTVLKSLDLFR